MSLEVAVLIGVQGSGKSTFYRQCLASTHILVSKDAMRSTKHREARQRRDIASALGAGWSVVVDNTNASAAEREPIVGIAREHGARVVAYLFPLDVAAQAQRNARRIGRERVPDVGFYSTVKRFQMPGPDEGFDDMFRVTLGDGGGFDVQPLNAR